MNLLLKIWFKKPFLKINMSFLQGKGMEETEYKEGLDCRDHELIVLLTTDRGMCGATNSGVIRNTRNFMLANSSNKFTLAIAGAKGISGLRQMFVEQYHTCVQELGKKHLSFVDVEPLIEVLDDVTDYGRIRIVSNRWDSIVASTIMHRMLPNPKNMVDEMKEAYYGYEYDGSEEDELFKNLQEHLTACVIYSCLIENTAVELAARMNSMDNATTNAGEMHSKLSILYNRTRQARITTELSEIISGAAAVQEAD